MSKIMYLRSPVRISTSIIITILNLCSLVFNLNFLVVDDAREPSS